MEFLLYILGGAFVGWIASMVAGTNKDQGAIGNILVGVLGAFLGSFLMRTLGGSGVTGFNISSFLVALLGAVILLFVYKAIRKGIARNPL